YGTLVTRGLRFGGTLVPLMCYLSVALLAAAGAEPARAQQRPITGRVTSATSSEPGARANVSVAGTAITALTSEQGEFSLSAPEGNVTLIVRRIGFKRREIAVSAAQGRGEGPLAPGVPRS